MTYSSLLTRISMSAAVAALYLICGKLGLMLAVVHPSATAVWAPTGIALAAFLRLGYGVWPAIFIAAFLVNATTAGSIATSIGIAIGNTLEGALGCYLVTRFARGADAFKRPADVFRFTACAALASTVVSATLGVTSLTLGGYAARADYGRIWFTWWLGDAAGALIVTPLLLLWSADRRLGWNRNRGVEALAAFASVVLAADLVFGPWTQAPLAFLCIPPLVWVAYRLGTREAATALAVLSAIALWGTAHGFGPFPLIMPGKSLISLGAFGATVAVTTLALAAAVSERERADERRRREAAERARAYEALEKSEALHRAIAELTSDFAVILRVEDDGAGSIETATEGFERVTGYVVAELSEPGGWRRLMPEDTALVLEAAAKLVLSGERVAIELRVVSKERGARWLRCHAQPLWDPTHTRVVRILGAAEDVTERRETDEALRKQQEVIRELSTPVLRIRERLLILPLIGQIDALRAAQLTDQLLDQVRIHRAKVIVIDLTGAAVMLPNVARHIVRTTEASRLLGASIIVTGVSREMADALVSAGVDLSRLYTFGDLQRGMEEAERLLTNGTPAISRHTLTRASSPVTD
jgi:PAS domain S-box-containing protein